jgi:GNAT superfamily N-acetyltransferase
MPCTIEVTANQAKQDSSYIEDQLRRFNLRFSEPDQHAMLRVFARNAQGELVGGLLGETFWRWLYIADLWVHEDYRRSGLGTQLLAAAEEEARRRGCLHAYLDTLEFQAPKYYPKFGYMIWGTLDDFPPGHRRIFFKKDL